MAERKWKRAERGVAKLLGGRRLPNDGTGRPDILLDDLPLAPEVKSRTIPKWLKNALKQAKNNAGELMPIVVLVESRQGVKAKRVVAMDFEVFQELISDA